MTTQVADPNVSPRIWHAQRINISRLPNSSFVQTTALPSFSDPFISAPRIPAPELFVDTTLAAHQAPQSARTSISSASSSTLQYANPPITTTASSSPVVPHQVYDQSFLNQGLMPPADFSFSAASSPVNPVFSQNSFDLAGSSFMGDVRHYNLPDIDGQRRSPQTSMNVVGPLAGTRDLYSIDQDTPRGPYAPAHPSGRSADSYNFPSAHSSTSSISSVGSNFSNQYSSAMDAGSGLSDYSDVDVPIPSSVMRTSQPVVSNPSSVPAQSSMMTQFSSKVSSSVQKKHACKICEKRFTRPSSLQTHVYSHTGEKPYQCTQPGCGRCFSVVSNLRRHQKIHRNRGRDHSVDPADSRSEADSPTCQITEGDE